MQGIQILLTPFVWVLSLFYNFFGNYGMALILFAVLVKLILFPLSIKGKKSMIQMNMLQGRMQKLQQMYGNNKEKYNEEVQKLYEKEKVNPMSGCLWSFIPVLIIFPLYAIIRQPLTYMMNLTPEVISQVAAALNWDTVAVANGWITQATVDAAVQAATEAGTAFVTSFQNTGYNQLYLSSLINADTLAAVQAVAGEGVFALNFDFLGVNLALVPQLQFWTVAGGFGLFILPVLSAVSGVLFSFISMRTNAVNKQSAQAANSSSKMMMFISPLISLWIGFSMPAALSVYWIANSLLSMLQEFIASRMLKKDYEKAAAEAARREAEEKEAEKRRKEEARQERARRIEEAKQNRGKKKKPAPKKEDNAPSIDREASRVGIRAYARGRAYDPYRFSPDGPTPYLPGDTVDDAAVEKALEKQAEEREKAEFAAKYGLTEEDMKEVESAAQADVEKKAAAGGIEEVQEQEPASGEENGADGGEAPSEPAGAPVFETPKYTAPDYDAPSDGKSPEDEEEREL